MQCKTNRDTCIQAIHIQAICIQELVDKITIIMFTLHTKYIPVPKSGLAENGLARPAPMPVLCYHCSFSRMVLACCHSDKMNFIT